MIFLPLAFLSGVTGAFFKALSLTMASALIVSYLLTWVAVPLLAARLLDEAPCRGARSRPLHPAHDAAATRTRMRRWLTRPWLMLIADLPCWRWAGWRIPGRHRLHAAMDEGGFILDYLSAPGTSLTETNRLLRQVEAIIRANP